MTYAIGNIVYGINLNDPEFRRFDGDIEILTESEIATSQYSGNGDPPRYLGVDLDCIDECGDIHVSSLKLAPSDEDKEEFKKILANALAEAELSDEFREMLGKEEPVVFITWGSS